MLKNTINDYGTVTRYLHWIMAFIIIGLLTVGYTMKYLMPAGDIKWQLYTLHKVVGVIALVLAIFRLTWRCLNTIPQLMRNLPTWQQNLAWLNICLLYLLMIMMPLSGLLMSLYGGHAVKLFNLYTIQPFVKNSIIAGYFNNLHYLIGILFSGAIIMHFCGALFDHYIRHDNILRNMLRR